MSNSDEAWGELCSQELFPTPVKLIKSKVIIGRAKDCDIQIESKVVSAQHCYLERNDTGCIWLIDTSTNGTIINGSFKVRKGCRHNLTDGDEIFLVYKKKSPEMSVGFVYKEVKQSAESDENSSQATIIIDTSDATIPSNNSSPLPSPDYIPINKKPKTSEFMKADATSSHASDEAGPSNKTATDDRQHASSAADNTDHAKQMEMMLLCSICQEIFYDCISLQPCMHCFCASCYALWLKQSNECPQCRKEVVQVSKNHILNNLVEGFFQQYPAKKRSDSVIQELEGKSKAAEKVLFAKGKRADKRKPLSPNLNSDSSDSDFSDNDHDYSCYSFHPSGGHMPASLCRQCSGYQGPYPPRCSCVTCLGSTTHRVVAVNCSIPHMPSTSSAPSLHQSGSSHMQYTCRPNPVHALCNCCLEPMPDRRHERSSNTNNIPPQQCSRCFRLYCHMYWGCRRSGCSGCLNKFLDLNFGENSLTGAINENYYESQILKDYLRAKNLTWQDMFRECVQKVQTGEYQSFPAVTADTVLCYSCGLVNFRQLVYLYRKSILQDELPNAVTSRPDCYWGRNCRTQKHHPTHAQKYNHICEQTRFT